MMHLSDLIVQWVEMVTQIQMQYEQLKQKKGMIEAVVFEVRVEELQARTEKVLDEMRGGWLSWVEEEGEDVEQYSLYQVEEQRATKLLHEISDLKGEDQKLISDMFLQWGKTFNVNKSRQ